MSLFFRRNTLLLFVCFIAIEVFPQSRTNKFSDLQEYVSETSNITWKKPKGYIDLGIATPWGPEGIRSVGIRYGSVLQSKDKNSLIMYPDMRIFAHNPRTGTYIGNDILARNQMVAEMNAALGLADKQKNTAPRVLFDFDKYVTVLSGTEARSAFNADTVYIAQIPLSKPYMDIYTYCTGIYIYKKDRALMFFKCFFTEKGKQDENRYISTFCKSVKYRADD